MASAAPQRHSCDSASETLEWMNAITSFLLPSKPLIDSHVVNFFKDNLWEIVDKEWMDCLCKEPVQNLLQLPSGIIQDYWPSSLKEFVTDLKALSIFREQNLTHPILQSIDVVPLCTVLSQGMIAKKKHEVEILAGVISKIAEACGAEAVVDVGSGQGYLAQVLSFEYRLSVIALDASVHHATVTKARSDRIAKHYKNKCATEQQLKVPQTVTCRVLSSDTLANLTNAVDLQKHVTGIKQQSNKEDILNEHFEKHPLVLAGLHACGDLSVNMLRAFVGCGRAKALVSLGCCYNLLSEEEVDPSSCSEFQEACCISAGFPMSKGAKLFPLSLGKSARDLACQSAERWRSLTTEIALQNFDVHAYRAAFQLVLEKHFPEVVKSSPSIGRQGKALRRRRLAKLLESQIEDKHSQAMEYNEIGAEVTSHDYSDPTEPVWKEKYGHFKEFCESGLLQLGCGSQLQESDLIEVWGEVQPFTEMIGPFWSLRVALGQVIETYILLDRLLYLQEQGDSINAFLLPLFDPAVSPRNMAVVAMKVGSDLPKS
ncbi:S-adenosyl-L-methionine-dependent methyltransferases superfamily protein [Rhynchospora pubera]|uniref:S-adenosyl-L-methionine-dependent methyltransferases superfamily protein n=1 Tax=Rhynchospora pubera TaxID=906938 RepID=A0AAV8EQG4_9POAL|nr:S-adenosyl-L-methionine-dependent methyltransferases superfamily protein [Rhynchospora pubera]